MANTNAPFGFRPLGLNGGSSSATFGMIERKIASNNSAAIYKQDPVEDLATGYIEQWDNGSVVSRMVGIFWGCKYYSTAFQRVVWSNYWPGSGASGDVTAYLIPCIASPTPKFVVQAAATEITFADIGRNVDVTLGTGDTTTGISGATIESGTTNTTATLPFRIEDLWSNVAAPGSPGTEAGAYNWVIVSANVTQVTGI